MTKKNKARKPRPPTAPAADYKGMLQFVETGPQMPEKRSAEERRHDFGEICIPGPGISAMPRPNALSFRQQL